MGCDFAIFSHCSQEGTCAKLVRGGKLEIRVLKREVHEEVSYCEPYRLLADGLGMFRTFAINNLRYLKEESLDIFGRWYLGCTSIDKSAALNLQCRWDMAANTILSSKNGSLEGKPSILPQLQSVTFPGRIDNCPEGEVLYSLFTGHAGFQSIEG